MFVELIELLRCPRPHEESQLVVAATRSEDRHIVDGVLGCPVCGVEFAVKGGVAHFGMPAAATAAERPDADTALRLAALLELTDTRGFAVLSGRWCAQLDGIQRIAETPVVLVNPPRDIGGIPAGVLECDVAPFAPGSLRAAALDESPDAALRDSIVRAVRTGGRIVGPASLAVPVDVAELTRDAAVWVGEKQGTIRLVGLGRGATANPRA